VSSFEEFPVWVPLGDDRMLGVVCAPDGELEDLGVVLLTGGNYTRTHRNGMWVRAARQLAAFGVPSIRVDYHGVGDSTGHVELELERPLVEDSNAACDFLVRATGVSRLAVVATCFGGRGAMAVSAQRGDVISTTVLPVPIMVPAVRSAKAPLRRRVRGWIKSHEVGRRLLRNPRVMRARVAVAERRATPAMVVSPGFRKDSGLAAKKGRVRFVYGETTEGLPEVGRLIDELRPHLTIEELARIEVDVVQGTDLLRFQTFADQDVVVQRAVDTAVRELVQASEPAS